MAKTLDPNSVVKESEYIQKLKVEMAKKRALLNIAKNQGVSEQEFEKKLNAYINEYGSKMGINILASELGYFNNFEGDENPNTLGDPDLLMPNYVPKAKGGRIKKYGGGVTAAMPKIPTGTPRVNAGGISELDYRAKGGFVPVGVKEKADDVPAMLSKNEFVMTADAVKGAGGGNVEKGAQKMYNTMKRLEGRVA